MGCRHHLYPCGCHPQSMHWNTMTQTKCKGLPRLTDMSGFNGNDKMYGFAGNDQMDGGLGDDTMSGGSGDDFMLGREGDDNINGDSGDDTILGFRGADILKGSSGNDRIFHDFLRFPVDADGSKDTIDCGSGNDEAWINTSTDGDTADSNCETVHAG